MKKILVTGIVLIIFIVYAIFYHKSSPEAVATVPNTNSLPTGTTGSYKNGTYLGSAADAYYGTIQVKAIVQDGKLADVQFVQYPNDQEESMQVSNQAMPMLKQEAIQTQNASVDIVSGATQTSQAFKES